MLVILWRARYASPLASVPGSEFTLPVQYTLPPPHKPQVSATLPGFQDCQYEFTLLLFTRLCFADDSRKFQ